VEESGEKRGEIEQSGTGRFAIFQGKFDSIELDDSIGLDDIRRVRRRDIPSTPVSSVLAILEGNQSSYDELDQVDGAFCEILSSLD